MRIALVIVGVIALLVGLLWVGQGLGYVQWPASSFMLDRRPWAWRGAGLAAIGIILLVAARRRRR